MTASLAILGLIAVLVVYEVLDQTWDRGWRPISAAPSGSDDRDSTVRG